MCTIKVSAAGAGRRWNVEKGGAVWNRKLYSHTRPWFNSFRDKRNFANHETRHHILHAWLWFNRHFNWRKNSRWALHLPPERVCWVHWTWSRMCAYVSIKSPVVDFELVDKYLHRASDLVNLKQQLGFISSICPWKDIRDENGLQKTRRSFNPWKSHRDGKCTFHSTKHSPRTVKRRLDIKEQIMHAKYCTVSINNIFHQFQMHHFVCCDNIRPCFLLMQNLHFNDHSCIVSTPGGENVKCFLFHDCSDNLDHGGGCNDFLLFVFTWNDPISPLRYIPARGVNEFKFNLKSQVDFWSTNQRVWAPRRCGQVVFHSPGC